MGMQFKTARSFWVKCLARAATCPLRLTTPCTHNDSDGSYSYDLMYSGIIIFE